MPMPDVKIEFEPELKWREADVRGWINQAWDAGSADVRQMLERLQASGGTLYFQYSPGSSGKATLWNGSDGNVVIDFKADAYTKPDQAVYVFNQSGVLFEHDLKHVIFHEMAHALLGVTDGEFSGALATPYRAYWSTIQTQRGGAVEATNRIFDAFGDANDIVVRST